MATAFSVFLLLVLCGFIAYIGDLLGRRLGKKRLSVFGLRPKHTAILLTIVTGVLIASVTFGAALATIPGFAEVVMRGEQLNRENKALDRQNRKMRLDADLLTASSRRLQGQNEGLRQVNDGLSGANRTLADTNKKLNGDNGRLRTENVTLGQANRGLEGHNRELRQGNERLTGANNRLQSQQRTLVARVRGLNADISRLKVLESSFRDDQYLFRRGEEIDRRPIISNPPREVLQQLVDTLVYQVRSTARAKGVKAPGHAPDVKLMDPPGFPFTAGGDPVARERRIRDWVVARMLEVRDKPLTLRILAGENCVEGQPVRVRLDWYANPTVIGKGQVLGRKSVDGRDSPGVILANLVALLQGDVNRHAREATMVPREQGVGETNYDLLLEAVNRVRELGGPAQVVARARYDTPRSGPLILDLNVEPAAASAAER